MLLVFAYSCNLRVNLIYKPTENPIDSYEVRPTIKVDFKQYIYRLISKRSSSRRKQNNSKCRMLTTFVLQQIVDLGLIPLISNNSPAVPYFKVPCFKLWNKNPHFFQFLWFLFSDWAEILQTLENNIIGIRFWYSLNLNLSEYSTKASPRTLQACLWEERCLYLQQWYFL